MNSIEDNESVNCSVEALIDWSSPVIVNKTYGEDNYNNPFDIMELRAANMDPFDLVHNQTSFKGDMSCSSILTTSWQLDIGPLKNSFLSTDDNENESKNESVLPSTPNYDNIDLEKMMLCNEEEKQQIREKTRQRIKKLIENKDKSYEKYHTQKSLSFMALQCSDSSLNNTEHLFNKGFMLSSSNSIFNSFCKTPNSMVDINDNSPSNISLMYPNIKHNSFDLNAFKNETEWLENSCSDVNGYVEIKTDKSEPEVEPINNNNEIDLKLKALNRIGIIESESNGSRTFLKSLKNKKPFLANIPVHHMMQNIKDTEKKNIFSSIIGSKLKPVAFSTPTSTSNIATEFHTPLSEECSFTSCSTKQAIVNSIESPKTPFNVTKCVKQNPTNIYTKHYDTIASPNVSYSFGSAYKHFNTLSNSFTGCVQNKTEIIKSFQSNKSKSESSIGKMTKPTNKRSSLPVLKQTTNLLKRKENVKQ